MLRRAVLVLLLVVVALPLSGALARDSGTPGLTSSSILIGGTVPLSGVASGYASVARGADAYFKYVNDHGGVNGRKIVYKYVDDAYDPAQTVQATRQLVQQDQVFAIFNSLGTEQNLAIRGYLNQQKIPQLFVATGASTFGADYKRYPWTIGYQPSYVAEAIIYGKYIVKTKPGAKIAVLYQNDDYGKDLIAGLTTGLGSHKSEIVSKQGYDLTATDVNSQMAKLKASGANTLMVFATPKIAIEAYVGASKLGWKPQIFVNSVSAASNIMKIAAASSDDLTEGSISIVFLKDPTNPRWDHDPAIKLYRSIMAKYGSGDVTDVYNVYAMAVAWTFVDVLKQAGKNPTRDSVMNAALHLNEPANPFVIPGIRVHTTPSDRFPMTQALLQRWHGVGWQIFTGLLNARG